MAFGIYIHIPYCIQRCSYCDFATYEQSQILPPEKYFELLREELLQKAEAFPDKKVDTVYFGGGTPSLVPAPLIVSVLELLTRQGFLLDQGRDSSLAKEITIEINPATVSEEKLELYLRAGINRFSVGAQTFHNDHLKHIGRKHNSEETIKTLELLTKYKLNYSFDLIFALPYQTQKELEHDLDMVTEIAPNHVSPYCLTVPEGHALAKNRPLEEAQLEMFSRIEARLLKAGYERYEISNFARPGFHSKHNTLYWQDEPYWGLGLGAHSYDKSSPWGTRYWNPNSIGEYESLVRKHQGHRFGTPTGNLPESNFEILEKHQALTDFCHTSLRQSAGLSKTRLEQKFSAEVFQKIEGILAKLVSDGNLAYDAQKNSWSLTSNGIVLSNQVFAELTFLNGEL